jgi:hypothetical protein
MSSRRTDSPWEHGRKAGFACAKGLAAETSIPAQRGALTSFPGFERLSRLYAAQLYAGFWAGVAERLLRDEGVHLCEQCHQTEVLPLQNPLCEHCDRGM